MFRFLTCQIPEQNDAKIFLIYGHNTVMLHTFLNIFPVFIKCIYFPSFKG